MQIEVYRKLGAPEYVEGQERRVFARPELHSDDLSDRADYCF